MFKRVVVTALMSWMVVISEQVKAESVDVEPLRVRRDTAEWFRQSSDAPLLQDFRNGTTNNASATVWKKCQCAGAGCDCTAEYQDFSSKLHFRVEHIKTHLRFRVTFRDENRTISQQFVLVNGTSCFQFRKNFFDQVCFYRYGAENNTFLEKACLAVGVRIQSYSSVAADFECIKHMNDGTTHVGPLNMTSPDLNFLSNYTLYGTASCNTISLISLVASLIIAFLFSKTGH